jgi:hypothetical protein
MVHDRPYFSNKMMPYYFRAKFTSFRQLLRKHGFSQMGGNGWDEGAYYHCLFVRDDPVLFQGMTQQQMKDAMPDWIPASEEPNFYTKDAPETKPNAVASTGGATTSSKKETAETSESGATEKLKAASGDAESEASLRGSNSSSSSSQLTCLEYLYASKSYKSEAPTNSETSI